MSKPCLIISGGEFSPFNPPAADAFVIACDRGYEYACRCGVRPDLVLGDFDSFSGEVDVGSPSGSFPQKRTIPTP